MIAWYAATTKPNQEERAERELRRQGYLVAVPKVRVRARTGYVVRPYFRGYALVAFDSLVDWWWPEINGTKGVSRLVMSGGRPSRLRSEAMERVLLEAGVDGMGFVTDERLLDEAIYKISVGDDAKVAEGPFAGHIGRVNDIEIGHARMGLMIEVLGKAQRIEFPVEALRVAGSVQQVL